MKQNSQHGQRSQPTFVAWLTQNPTGIPVRQALWRVAFGILLGLVRGWLVGEVASCGHTRLLWSALGALSGRIGGEAAGMLAGLAISAIGVGVSGGLTYQIRGLGVVLGITVGWSLARLAALWVARSVGLVDCNRSLLTT
jgi:hypothetical protein